MSQSCPPDPVLPPAAVPRIMAELVELAESRGLLDVGWRSMPFVTRDGTVEMMVLSARTSDGRKVESNPIDLRPIRAHIDRWTTP